MKSTMKIKMRRNSKMMMMMMMKRKSRMKSRWIII